MDARVIDPSRCFECGAPASDEHHVVPQVLGGTQTVPLCYRHHRLVHGKDAPADVTTSALVREGLKKAREAGTWMGRPPYGYTVTRRERMLCEIPIEQSVIRACRTAREHGWSTKRIAHALNRWGVSQRNGSPWSCSAVWSMLKSADKARPTAEKPVLSPPAPVVIDERFLPGQKTLPIFEALD